MTSGILHLLLCHSSSSLPWKWGHSSHQAADSSDVLQMAGEQLRLARCPRGTSASVGETQGLISGDQQLRWSFQSMGEVSCPPEGTLIPAMSPEKSVFNQFTHSGCAGKAGDQPGQLCKGSHSGTGTTGKDKVLLPASLAAPSSASGLDGTLDLIFYSCVVHCLC